MAAATTAGEAAMAGEATVRGETGVSVCEAVAPPTMMRVIPRMIPVTPAMTPVTPAVDPAIGVSVVDVTSGRVANWPRASGQAKSDSDQ